MARATARPSASLRRKVPFYGAILLALLAVAAAASTDVVIIASNDTPPALPPSLPKGSVPLKLCECERATGAPDGLSCDKEGWFVSSFERQGQWVAGGGFVPLSHAVCCRPCLPKELPPDASGRVPAGEKPIAVVSLGCHASTDAIALQCETDAASFVSGFTQSVRVLGATDAFYPVDSSQCCTPSLLLQGGDSWELERCGCRDANDPDSPVSCGGTTSNELLVGFPYYR
jgi:hypothetical protein